MWVLAAVVAFLLGIAVGRQLGRPSAVRDLRDAPAPASALPPVAPDDPALVAEVALLVAAGQKIEAIKRVREATGLGLKEARDLVEAWPGT